MQRFQSQVKWGSFPLNVAQFCFIYISPASDGWIPELSYFPFFFSSVIAQSACPGRIRLDDAVRYENKRGIDIWYKSKLCLRYGRSLCLAKLERIKIPLQTCTPLIWQYVNISIPYTNALMRYFSITLDSHLARSDRVSACVSPLSWVGHIVKVHVFPPYTKDMYICHFLHFSIIAGHTKCRDIFQVSFTELL